MIIAFCIVLVFGTTSEFPGHPPRTVRSCESAKWSPALADCRMAQRFLAEIGMAKHG
ncbi:hypothetical protein BO86DRAFT_388886 [Aspergillus japonicus CBS 114.51]|uniref:Uncharacterized protein n=1 Tax=Aspergillus japonicus CBS 114.51 TaxID=1448312 RepID=A0A8T8X3D8_ASPJA|nr:hypothetical protein BO86DRAFT_388886 [Aspergillus japonicus CBS 114.51]RAH82450.1 hypothetical protein BO86DRAFT_388886 [Aspergillus japonicus CBS 114.51]